MNQIKGLFLATLLGSCSLAQAATLSFPEELVPLQVNGEKVEHSLFSKKLDFNLPVGTHQVQVKYSDLYELDYDEHQTVSSEPFWVEVTIAQDGEYRLGFNRAGSIDTAEKFAQSPSVYVITPDNAQQKIAKVQPKAAIAPAVLNTGMNAGQASNTQLTAKIPAKLSKHVQAGPNPSAELMLYYWWQQADKQQREAFLKAIKVKAD
jgi:uncharacterized protein YccT (UPF0319 family)